MANRFDVLNNEIRRLSQDNHPTQGVVDPFVLDNNEPDEDFTTDDQGCLLRDDDIGGWLEIQTFLRVSGSILLYHCYNFKLTNSLERECITTSVGRSLEGGCGRCGPYPVRCLAIYMCFEHCQLRSHLFS